MTDKTDITATQTAPDRASAASARVDSASQWRLMWWQFKRHKLAMASSVVLLMVTLVGVFCEFIAPFAPDAFSPRYTYAPRKPCTCSIATRPAT